MVSDNRQEFLRLYKWRLGQIARELYELFGDTVGYGPFKGLHFVDGQIMPCHRAGVYESGLHDVVEEVIAAKPSHIVNIGCSWGYYAVGLAKRLLDVQVLAFDIDLQARLACEANAKANGVSELVRVMGAFDWDHIDETIPKGSTFICDIEGGEEQVLLGPGSKRARVYNWIIEAHDFITPGLSDRIVVAYEDTHDIQVIRCGRININLPQPLCDWPTTSQILLLEEGRIGPTPWLIMRRKG